MSIYQSLETVKVPAGSATIYGLDQSFLKKNKFLNQTKGIILFVHGFNSSAQIWGDDKNGFVASTIQNHYIPFVIDFSDSLNGSIINLADQDLFSMVDYVRNFLQNNHLTNKRLPLFFITHSMGGIITRYFFSLKHQHAKHTASDLHNLNIKAIALLGVPNHGISKANSDNFVTKMEKIIGEFNSLAGEKHSVTLVNKAFFQLLSGNSIISSLLADLPSNMWPELFWMNFIASKDIVVDRTSSFFPPEEVSYLKNNFYQTEFDATHMRNPFHAFTDALHNKIPFTDSKLFSKIESKTPDFLGYLTKEPIYANTELIEEFFRFIKDF